MSASPSEELVVIIDASARGWIEADATGPAHLQFESFKESVTAFLLAFRAMSRDVQPVILAFNDYAGGYLYPPLGCGDGGTTLLRTRVDLGLSLLRYQAPIEKRLGGSLLDADGALHALGIGTRLCSMAACLCAAVCHINRRRVTAPRHSSRVLVFQAGSDVAADYIALVNAIYTCVRLDVPIDSVNLAYSPPTKSLRDSSSDLQPPSHALVLQQAALVSGGRHSTPNPRQRAALLEFLLTVCLPDNAARSTSLLLPLSAGADLRAHCFCHAQQQSLGWVCPVCLAVWCSFAERCGTCGTSSGAKPTDGPDLSNADFIMIFLSRMELRTATHTRLPLYAVMTASCRLSITLPKWKGPGRNVTVSSPQQVSRRLPAPVRHRKTRRAT